MTPISVLNGLRTIEKSFIDVRPDERVTEETEPYPCYRGRFSHEALRLQKKFVGMLKYGDCLKKNEIAFDCLKNRVPHARLVVGAMRVWSEEAGAFYGFNYEPPWEFHAWVEIGRKPHVTYIDLALGGVIERGSLSGDEQGPYLVGIKPFVLWGQICPFVFYEKVRVVGEVRV